jgi:hypothetical protein
VREHERADPNRPRDKPDGAAARAQPPGPLRVPDQVLELQRRAGNRAVARTLARWAAHPDPEKKGVMVPDVVAAEFLRFNPPKSS